MSGPLIALKQVATLDSQIFRLEGESREIPENLRHKEKGLEEARKRLAANGEGLIDLRVKTELREKEFQAAEQIVIKLRQQISQAKSNKEFQTLQHEILSKEADNAQLEDAVLVQMQKVDRQKEEVGALAREVKKAEAALEAERARLQKQLDKVEADIQALREKRAAASKKVPGDIFAKYERLISRRGQTAMVAAVNGTCQGCFMTLRPETIAQLKKGNDLVFCHSCARILYLEE